MCHKYKLIKPISLLGNEKAFAAGADIKEMQNNTYSENVKKGFLKDWEDVSNCGKPLIAAVNGFAVSTQYTSNQLFKLVAVTIALRSIILAS